MIYDLIIIVLQLLHNKFPFELIVVILLAASSNAIPTRVHNNYIGFNRLIKIAHISIVQCARNRVNYSVILYITFLLFKKNYSQAEVNPKLT